MWWKTTEVYRYFKIFSIFSLCLQSHIFFRVSLPYTGIENLSQNPIKIFGEIGIFTHDAIRTKLLVEELQTQFRDNGKIVKPLKSVYDKYVIFQICYGFISIK